MGSINLKVPDGMEDELDEYVEESGMYLNQSEAVRDAIRRLFEEKPVQLSERTLEDDRVSREQIESGDTVPLK